MTAPLICKDCGTTQAPYYHGDMRDNFQCPTCHAKQHGGEAHSSAGGVLAALERRRREGDERARRELHPQ
jgi:hypothetical protein